MNEKDIHKEVEDMNSVRDELLVELSMAFLSYSLGEPINKERHTKIANLTSKLNKHLALQKS